MKKIGKNYFYFCVPHQTDERKEKFLDKSGRGGIRRFSKESYPDYEEFWNLNDECNLNGYVCYFIFNYLILF